MAFLEELRNSMGGGSPTKGAAKSVDPNDLENLGLGGLPSFLGTREDAAAGKRGDAQIAATLTDSLPGYFNPETRDYVPWYVDLFDGGGINRSAGMLDAGSGVQSQAVGGLMSPMRPTMRPEGPLGPFGGAGPNIPEGPLGPFGGAGPRVQDTPDTSYYTQPSSMQMPVQASPAVPYASTQQGVMPQMQDNMPVSTPAPRESTLNTLRENVYSVGPIEAMINAYKNRQETPPAQSSPTQVPAPAPAQSGQSVPASGGNMAINTPAAQGRDQMIADQQAYVHEQKIKSHPLYPQYVDFLNRSKLSNQPGLFEKYLRIVVGSN